MGFEQAFLSYKAADTPNVRAERMEEALREHADNEQAHEPLYYAAENGHLRAIRRQINLMGGAYFPDPVQGELLLDITDHKSEEAQAAAAALLVHEPDININPSNAGPLRSVILRYGYEQYIDPYVTTDLSRHELYRAAEGAYYDPDALEAFLSQDAAKFDPGELQGAFCRYANWAHQDTMDVRTPAPHDGADTTVQTLRAHGMPIKGGADFGRKLQAIEGQSTTHLLPVLMALHDGMNMGFRDTITDLIDDVQSLDRGDCNVLYDHATRAGSVPLSEQVLQRLIDENRLPDRSLMKRIKNRSTGPAQYLRDHLPRRADYASELNESTPSQDQ